jgi:outer membrane protein OmpA-like peptidoglycan-associated protein
MARKVVIEGHTDERGGREYNLALGPEAAEAVRRALACSGVPDSQVEAVSFGKEKPAMQGSDEAGDGPEPPRRAGLPLMARPMTAWQPAVAALGLALGMVWPCRPRRPV